MDHSDDRELYRRISQLENDIAEIKELLAHIAPGLKTAPEPQTQSPEVSAPASSTEPQPVVPDPAISQPGKQAAPPLPPPRPGGMPLASPPRPRRAGFKLPEHMKKIDYWMGRIGIGLILFGLVFAFKYSVDQGWITPPVRHLFGVGLGVILFAAGWRLYGRRRHFSQLLLGGGIAAFYITCFSAFQLFELVSHPTAFAFMVLVTLAAFFVALRQDDTIFSLVGVIGGLGTPFMLYTGAGSIPGLVIYTCVVLAGATAIYFFKGWRLLLWVSLIGGWIVLLLALDATVYRTSPIEANDQWAVQAGILFVWLCFWLAPVVRRGAQEASPARWRKSSLGIGDRSFTESGRQLFDRHVHLLAVGTPIVALTLSTSLWPDIADHLFGWSTVAAAALYGLAAWLLHRKQMAAKLWFTHAATGTILLTIAIWFLLQGSSLLIVWTAEALALHILARRLTDSRIAVGGHALFTVVAIGLYGRLLNLDIVGGSDLIYILTDLVVIAAVAAAAFIISNLIGRRLYLLAAVVALVLFFHRELSGDWLYFALILEVAAVYALARWLKDESLETTSHIGYVLMAAWLAVRLIDEPAEGTAFLNYRAAADALLMLSGLVVARFVRMPRERGIYLFVVHLALLGLLARELAPLENGQGFITIAWGIYGALLLVAGLRRDLSRLRQVALGTMILVVVKLFIVDLAELETIWRVLLFIGFGGVFLLLSYYFPRLWRTESK